VASAEIQGNKPGFRVADSPINRRAVHDAHAAFVHDLENAWRSPAACTAQQCPHGETQEDAVKDCDLVTADYSPKAGAIKRLVKEAEALGLVVSDEDPRRRLL
jgi:hypothetical protein